jgi:hypothetical protein
MVQRVVWQDCLCLGVDLVEMIALLRMVLACNGQLSPTLRYLRY